MKHLLIIDASALSTSSCMLRFYNIVHKGYTAKLNNNDVEFGTAFHKFRSHWRTTKDIIKALKIACEHYDTTEMVIKSNKTYLTTTFLQRVCLEYSVKYEKDQFQPTQIDNEYLIELRFALPFYVDDDIEVLVAGTMDEIGKWIGGIYCICDCKTSSVWDLESYFNGFNLSPQLLFYRWIFSKYAQAYPESIYAQIEKETELGIFIDGIFYKGKDQEIVYKRSKVFRFTEAKLKEFELLVSSYIMSLVDYVKRNIAPSREGMINGSCETKYGKCRFFELCNAPDIESQEAILEYHFKVEPYNPLTHQD